MDLSIATMLRQLRREAGLTQEQLAEKAGLSVWAVSAIERGRRHPYQHTFDQLAAALNLSPEVWTELTRVRGRERLSSAGAAVESDAPGGNSDAVLLTAHEQDGPIRPVWSALPLPHVPVPLTAMVGRAEEQQRLTAMLLSGTRLLTLTGPGGSGKTRLAQAVAASCAALFNGAVAFIDLSPVERPDRTAVVIAQSLGIQESQGRTPEQELTAYLRDRSLLLVLDNFEHLIDASPLVRSLAALCPALTLLITSRRPLLIDGEQEFPVEPLRLPSSRRGIDNAKGSPAVELFLQRALAVRPGFALTAENAAAVAEICIRLDGLPLALELAAARLHLLGPRELLERLSEGMGVLRSSRQDRPARHQTMAAAIDWSLALLTDREQVLFRRISVFVGAALPEIERLLARIDGDAASTLDVLEALVRHGLVRAVPDDEGGVRFIQLATIRAHARALLRSAGEEEVVRTAHARVFADLADAVFPRLREPRSEKLFRDLEREQDNLRIAHDWLLEVGDGREALRLAGALWWYWWQHAELREGCERLLRSLTLVAGSDPAAAAAGVMSDEDAALTVRALVGAGVFQFVMGVPEEGARCLQSATDLARRTGDPVLLSRTVNWYGNCLFFVNRLEESRRAWEEAHALALAVDDQLTIAGTIDNLSVFALMRGDLDEAISQCLTGQAIAVRLGDGYVLAGSLLRLGWYYLQGMRHDEARSVLMQLLPHLQHVRPYATTHFLLQVASIAMRSGQVHAAMQLVAAAVGSSQQTGAARVTGSLVDAQRDRLVERGQAQLPASDFAAVWQSGLDMSVEDAIVAASSLLRQG